jgi:hypothetical protein
MVDLNEIKASHLTLHVIFLLLPKGYLIRISLIYNSFGTSLA